MKQVRLPQTVENRLSSYTRQATTYQHVNHTGKLIKSSLLALAPLAAQGQQCNLGQIDISSPLNTPTCNKVVQIDIDGDGLYDFAFDGNGSFLSVTGGNSASIPAVGVIGTFSSSSAVFSAEDVAYNGIASTQVFQMLQNNPMTVAYQFILSIDGGGGNFYTPVGSTSTGYLVIEMDGKYGFIEVTIEHRGLGDRCISIGNYGVESPVNMATVLVGDCSTLPVELSNFKAKANENNILIDWETQSEYENAGFELQRSTNAQFFRKIAWIEGHGTTSEAQRYAFKDEKTEANQVYYYRLMQLDLDGGTTYSNVISAEIEAKQSHIGMINPTPVQEFANLPLNLIKPEKIQITIFDNQGRKMQYMQQMLDEGKQEISIDMSGLANGSYFARVDVGTTVFYRKIMKVN